jgi:hypothetical protein
VSGPVLYSSVGDRYCTENVEDEAVLQEGREYVGNMDKKGKSKNSKR